MKKNILFISLFLVGLQLFSQKTFVPDNKFELYLETHDANGNYVFPGNSNSMGDGILNNDLVLSSRISNVRFLNVNDKGIYSLEGINDFHSLRELKASFNYLSSIDVSGLRNLTLLYLADNNLTSLDLSHNDSIFYLDCQSNYLTNLDFSNLSYLRYFYGSDNRFRSIDLSHNANLFSVSLSANPQLREINVKNGNITELAHFDAISLANNAIVCVGNIFYARNNFVIDGTTSFSMCFNRPFFTRDKELKEEFTVYPNPAKTTVVIKGMSKPIFVKVYDMFNTDMTSKVKQYDNQLDLSKLDTGVYVVKVMDKETNEILHIDKVIKK